MIKELIEHMVKTIVSQPDKVQVVVSKEQDTAHVTISVASQDRGRLIGREGKTIRALRLCVDALTPRDGTLLAIELAED
jgi:predicted RNA-binding protein YlqC (UPF0109 family)